MKVLATGGTGATSGLVILALAGQGHAASARAHAGKAAVLRRQWAKALTYAQDRPLYPGRSGARQVVIDGLNEPRRTDIGGQHTHPVSSTAGSPSRAMQI